MACLLDLAFWVANEFLEFAKISLFWLGGTPTSPTCARSDIFIQFITFLSFIVLICAFTA